MLLINVRPCRRASSRAGPSLSLSPPQPPRRAELGALPALLLPPLSRPAPPSTSRTTGQTRAHAPHDRQIHRRPHAKTVCMAGYVCTNEGERAQTKAGLDSLWRSTGGNGDSVRVLGQAHHRADEGRREREMGCDADGRAREAFPAWRAGDECGGEKNEGAPGWGGWGFGGTRRRRSGGWGRRRGQEPASSFIQERQKSITRHPSDDLRLRTCRDERARTHQKASTQGRD